MLCSAQPRIAACALGCAGLVAPYPRQESAAPSATMHALRHAGRRLLPLLQRWLGMFPALACLAAAAGGVWATHGPLFSWPAQFLEPQAGALAFALMKTCGALGGFVGPFLVGLLADEEGGSFAGAMLLLAAVAASAALVLAGVSV